MPKHIVNSSYFAELGPGTLVIKANVLTGFKVVDHMADPTEVLDVVVTVAKDVIVMSDTPDKAAISGEGLAPGSTLTVINNGFIIGCGGRGGSEEDKMPPGPYFPEDGQPGGDAIFSPVDLKVSSSFGLVWGGGGGGGGYRYGGNFIPGCGGAGRTTLGAGGDVGAYHSAPSWLAKRTAVPFSGRGNGAGGPGNTANAQGQDGASQRGGDYGNGGSPYYGGQANMAPSPGPNTPYLTSVWNGGGEWGCPGYACAVDPGCTFTWLDDALTVPSAVKGLTGVRPDSKRPYKTRYSKFIEIYVTQDMVNFDVFAEAGRPTKPVSVFVYVAPGVTISSSSTARAALFTHGMPEGSFIFLKNRGLILGKGGAGGSHPSLVDPSVVRPREGQPGGDAVVFTIDGVIAQHPSFSYQNGPLQLPIWSVIAGGGGGGGYVRALPFETRGYGGNGGTGGGAAGLGLTANGKEGIPFVRPASSVHGSFNALDLTGTVWSDYEPRSAWLNTQARGGMHGCDGQASTSKLNPAVNPGVLDETHLGGPGGWAVVSTKSLLFCLTRALERNNRFYTEWNIGDWANSQTVQTAFVMGRTTHNTFSNMTPQAVRPPTDISAKKPIHTYLPITATRSDFVLAQELAGKTTELGYVVVVFPDVTVTSTDVTKGALELIDPDATKVCALVNFGIVIGRGGDGGGLGPNDDPNEVPILTQTTAVGRKANGKDGGPAIRYSFNALLQYSMVTYFTNKVAQTAHPLLRGGAGGGAGLYLAEYVKNNGNVVNGQLIPESVRLALGGGGGAGGGAGGRGSQGTASPGGINVIWTADNLWNSQEGNGYTLQYSVAGQTGLRGVTQVGRGGAVGAGAPANWPLSEASLSTRQQIPINSNTEPYPETAVRGVYGTGSRGNPGATTVKVSP